MLLPVLLFCLVLAKPRAQDTRGVLAIHGNCFEGLSNVPVANNQGTNYWNYRSQLVI
jgi:hypothetical protein